ncbi:hypothetical protein [Streptomyces poriferorum]|uniref:Uncharacterized protein n=1 Tax=Streptomyces poriferorum TaxID=2798799 RepID=A0ABY9IY14_9ACTN|nr:MULTISPECIES: hypothetical protein [unclassified Streptomyces]MDP5310468.1 hypothetical protein [Streptomyces sp. Alt4]WLQ60378.1 hypothetical protein P8A19_35365 [Streptomyces sp. Alt2]
MSLHLGIRRPKPKHRAVDKVTSLRNEKRRLLGQLIGAADHIALLNGELADVRAKRAETEQVVVCLSANVEELTQERDGFAAANEALRKQLAPYLAADANRDAITVPTAERDTTAMEDQATAPIDVRPLWEAHGISPVIRIADAPAADDPRTPTWVPGPDSETTQSLRVA